MTSIKKKNILIPQLIIQNMTIVFKNETIWSISLSDCIVGNNVTECADLIADDDVIESAGDHCLQWNEEKMSELEGTSFHYNVKQLQEKYNSDRVERISMVFKQMIPEVDGKIVMLSTSQLSKKVRKQNHKPNCKYVIDGDKLCLIAVEDLLVKDFDNFSIFSVCYRTDLSSDVIECLYDVTVVDKSNHPGNNIEIAFEVPLEAVDILSPFLEGSTCSSINGNLTKHNLTIANPYPMTLRLSARSHQSCSGEAPTEDSVDCCLEKLLSSMKDSITSKTTRWDIRSTELDILISSLSRLSHGTTLRKNGACHKILREPPVVHGETLAGVPLHKCLSVDTAVEHPTINNNGLCNNLSEIQIRTLQVCVLIDNLVSFLPKLNSLEVPPPCMWSANEVEFLKGTSAYEKVLTARKQMNADLTHLRTINGPHITTEAYQYATCIVSMCTIDVTLPDEAVNVDVSEGKIQPVTWVDYDGDRIAFRLNDENQLIYSLNSEDRPAVTDMEVINNGVGLRFPSIDREVDLVEPSSPNNAYQLIFSTIRALAEAAKVSHDIPKNMQFVKPSKTVSVIAPGAAMLPNRPIGKSPTFSEGSVWFTADDTAEDSDNSEQLGVAHLPVGNSDLVLMRGEFFENNPFSNITFLQKIPCRTLGAAETDSDIIHGLQLQVYNMLSEEGTDDVSVALPDLEMLQSGQQCFFTVTHKFSLKNFARSLLWFELVATIDFDVVKSSKSECTTLTSIKKLIREHSNLEKAVTEVCKQLDAISSQYPSKSNSWDEENPKRQLALKLAVEELEMLEHIKKSLQSLEKF